MECLQKKLLKSIKQINQTQCLVCKIPGNLTKNYCGGGDIYIEKCNTGSSLVVFSGQYEVDGEE